MFQFSKTFIIFLVVAVAMAGCDIVDEPYLVKVGSGGGNTGDHVRKVLLEDFTGQKCPNCPAAAELAHSLKIQYGEQLILLSVHAGFYSNPDATGNFTADYRTSTGNDLNAYFPFQAYPSGLINRTAYKGSVVLFKDSWQGAIDAQLDLPAQADILITNEFSASSRKLICSLESTFLENLEGTFDICVFLNESGIVSPQQTDAGVDTDYVHNHMLRASLNGTWGELVGNDGFAIAGNKLTDEFEITLDNAWNADNCTVIAFIYNVDTKEIIQAEEGAVVE